jgi:hypothetical protein
LETAGFIHWDVNPKMFSIGAIYVKWYTVLFVLSFVFGYYIMRRIYRREGMPLEGVDKIVAYAALGTLIGTWQSNGNTENMEGRHVKPRRGDRHIPGDVPVYEKRKQADVFVAVGQGHNTGGIGCLSDQTGKPVQLGNTGNGNNVALGNHI